MSRIERLKQLASQRREYAEDALKCEALADRAGQYDAALWRGLAAGWWRLVTAVGDEYERIAKGAGRVGPAVDRTGGRRPELN